MAEEDELRFEEISTRAENLLVEIGKRRTFDDLIEGLDRMEVAALTAALHAKADFLIWAAYMRREKAKEKREDQGKAPSPDPGGLPGSNAREKPAT